MIVMAPGDANDIGAMLDFSMSQDKACAIRYPKLAAAEIDRELLPIELGKSETLREGRDGVIVCAGTPLVDCLAAAEKLAEEGIDVGVVNARFVKPIDTDMVRDTIENHGFVVTVEEAMLKGGFGSAFLEAANELRVDATKVHRIGIPDVFVEHGDRAGLLADLRLDTAGIATTCRELYASSGTVSSEKTIS